MHVSNATKSQSPRFPMHQRTCSILDRTRPHASCTTSHAALEPTLACIATRNASLHHAEGIALGGGAACQRARWEPRADVRPRRLSLIHI